MNKAIVSYQKIFDANNAYDGTVVLDYVTKLKALDDHTPPLESFILVTNTSKQTYEYIGNDFEKTLGLNRDRMLNEGLSYYLSHYHPEDLPILLKAFEELMIFTMTQLTLEQRQRVVYSWNYRIKTGNGTYKNMQIQQTPIFFDTNGRPIIGYSRNTVVGDGKPKPLIATCKYLNANDGFETLFYKNYFYEAIERILTKREIEIAKLLASCMSTKDIAEKLYISTQTVDVHRKHIMKKLEMKSYSEIIEHFNKYQLL